MQQIHGLIHMKNWKFLKETCRYRNERDKNGVSICDGYPNQYGSPHNVLREFFFGVSGAKCMDLHIRKIEKFALFLKKGL